MTDPVPVPSLFPNPDDDRLSRAVDGVDQSGTRLNMRVVAERPLTLFLNGREIVTLMTIGDHPRYLAVGYLRNQNMLRDDDVVSAIDVADDLDTVVVRTARETDFEDKLVKKTLSSGCAQGTQFGDVMERFDDVVLRRDVMVRTSEMYALLKTVNTVPSLYQVTGALHGCVLAQGDTPLVYMEDVGRHNAVDKIAGYQFLEGVSGTDKVLYTTGRLTSEMVIKTVQMEVPILVSRSGFTASGVDLARRAGLTLIGRARGERFVVLSGEDRVSRDVDAATGHAG